MRTALLNILFPPQCLNCDTLVPAQGTLCLPCWGQVQFITDPCCERCGLPFEFAYAQQGLCGACLRQPPSFARARAVMRYNEASRQLVLKLKFQDQTLLAGTLAAWMASAGRDLLEQSEVIVPVPLHYWRFVARRYNQSALLAQNIGRIGRVPVAVDALRRVRHTVPQTGLTRNQRLENVRGVFKVAPRRGAKVRGKRVLLVDDVMTTRATIEECSKALLAGGAQAVHVLTLARTLDH